MVDGGIRTQNIRGQEACPRRLIEERAFKRQVAELIKKQKEAISEGNKEIAKLKLGLTDEDAVAAKREIMAKMDSCTLSGLEQMHELSAQKEAALQILSPDFEAMNPEEVDIIFFEARQQLQDNIDARENLQEDSPNDGLREEASQANVDDSPIPQNPA